MFTSFIFYSIIPGRRPISWQSELPISPEAALQEALRLGIDTPIVCPSFDTWREEREYREMLAKQGEQQ